ncbi:unnamed protein product [Triticum turgidum subsp. durum]|uniref:RING-type E3 ubiquitin transferase n=1 Tax=Triticum turgidum subsp. durum TaxID=4567 RepID=A0A9R0Q971_TRITD|nr:unnamed protein product [Triticum turgidum subsp. durum]
MFRQKNIINLYAPEIVVPNNDLEKQVLSLRDKNEFLENQQQKLIEEIKEYKRQILHQQRLINESSSKRQNEFVLDGARVMGIDASSQIIVASGRAPGVSAEHVLTKICMFSRQETKVRLPPNTKAVRDICITPGGLAIFASLGRKLSLLSMTTNNVVLHYDLPAPGWSCSGDQTGPNHVYAGLQNGMLLVFDTRQTKGPLHSLSGLSTNPVHTIHSVVDDNGSTNIISASSIGPCIWDVDGNENRPNLLTGMENQGVCISLACAAPSSDLIVASFRPRVEFSGDGSASQMGISQSPTLSGSGKLGCHALLRRTSSTSFVKEQICNGNVSELRMSKSAIIPCSGTGQHLFAYGDESLRGVRTWRLPSFQLFADLRPHHQPILDLSRTTGRPAEERAHREKAFQQSEAGHTNTTDRHHKSHQHNPPGGGPQLTSSSDQARRALNVGRLVATQQHPAEVEVSYGNEPVVLLSTGRKEGRKEAGSASDLCNNCKRPGHFARDCPNVSVCHACGLPGHIAAECSSKDLCWNCKEPGHMANACPNEGICRNCGKSGHIAKDCTAPPMLPGEVKLCNNCYKPGHIAVECTNEKACNNCRKSGHLARNCTNEPVCNLCHVAGHLARQCPKSDEINERGGPPPFRGSDALFRGGDALFRGGDAPFRGGDAPFRGGGGALFHGGYSDVVCRACNQVGHMSRDCMGGAFMICNNCGGRGHMAYECPSGRLLDRFPPRRY